MNSLYMFIIRAVLGGVFAVLLSRMFYPGATLIDVAGLAVILVGLAYVAEYFRLRRTRNVKRF